MARPIGYDPQDVLTKAMNVFWTKGYEATSIQDIVKVTGLKPGSLYNLYGNKDGLFKAVLEMYADSALKEALNTLNKSDNPSHSIENFLNEVVAKSISNERTNGCLLVKTLLVVSHKDAKIQEYITDVFSKVETILKETLQKAINAKQTKVDAVYFSKFIITTIYGAHVYYKSNHDRVALQETLEYLLKMLYKKC
jgi:TetR/AcrR family transcriptional repressor of nem operon